MSFFTTVRSLFKEIWSPSVERSFVFIVPLALGLTMAGYFFYVTLNDVPVTPCSPSSYPGRCYHSNQETCESIWQKAEAGCKAVIQKLQLPPTKLTEPIIFKCQEASVDRMLAVSRVSSPDCDQRHEELIEWRKRNPDF